MIVSIYNGYGIIPVFYFKSDLSHVPKSVNGIVHAKDFGKDKSIYGAEVAIPITYLPLRDSKIHYSICLRRMDLAKRGEGYYRMAGMIQDSPYIHGQEMNEVKYVTEHFGGFNIK